MSKIFNNLSHHPLIIGIDPDLVKNGIAHVVNGQLEKLEALPFSQLQNLILNNRNAVYVVEDVEFNKPVFNRDLSVKKNLAVAQDVGRVKGVARLIVEFLQESDARYVMKAPLKGHLKKAKGDAKYFNRLTGWSGRSNADKRDAALMALYGLKPGQLVLRPSEVPH